jgi:hypothetical protein
MAGLPAAADGSVSLFPESVSPATTGRVSPTRRGTAVEGTAKRQRPLHGVAAPIFPDLQCDARRVSIRALAKAAGVSDKTVKTARRGQRLRKSTVDKLGTALNELLYGDG